jgi:hypothetical protein
MTEKLKSPASSRMRQKKKAKADPMANVSTPTGGHTSRRKAGEQGMAEKENGSVFESIANIGGNLLSVEGAKKFAAWYIDTSEKVAKQAIDFQASATQWAKETPLAPIFEAQLDYGKKFVERSASAARSLWRLE